MQDHIRDSLNRFEYSQQLRKTAVFRILFDGQELSQVVTDLGIHSSYTLSRWVRAYQRKIETGLITLPTLTIQQKQDLQAIQQRNSGLEQASSAIVDASIQPRITGFHSSLIKGLIRTWAESY